MANIHIAVSIKNDRLLKIVDPTQALQFFNLVAYYIAVGARKMVADNAEKFFKHSEGKMHAAWYYKIWVDKDKKIMTIGVYNKKPYAKILNTTGVEPHHMFYLLYPKVNKPGTARLGTKYPTRKANWLYNRIPIMGEGGHIIIRTISEATFLKKPGWFHRGITPMHFLEDGLDVYQRSQMRQDIDRAIKDFDAGVRHG